MHWIWHYQRQENSLMQYAETIQIALQDLPEWGGNSGNGTISGNGVLKIENYVDQILQYPLAICKSVVWWDDAYAIPSNVRGNIAFAVDPGGAYCQRANWPWQQKWEPILLNPLGVYEIFPGGRRRNMEEYHVPVAYRDGDIIIVAPEIAPGSVKISRSWLALSIASETRIADWPVADQPFSIELANVTNANPGYCLRNLLPGPTAPATQVRVHVASHYTATQDCKISHVSIGVQDTGSSTVAAPVPMKFAGLNEYWMYPDTGLWTDWVDLPVNAGQSVLATVSLFNPTNSWSYSASGNGCWTSQTDSWNSAAMAGSVSYQENRTHVIDRVQYR
jgi:hypothetical protein